jgi:predicted methyltransferase
MILLTAALLAAAQPALAFPLPQRQVAPVVSPSWDSEERRDRANEARQVMRITGIKPGHVVADIGAGTGYYTVRVAPVVGPTGKVIAQDIVPRYLTGLRARVRRAGIKNVDFVLGSPSDPKLPSSGVDVALLIHMYHEIAQPYALLYRLPIVDLERSAEYHGMPKGLLVCEVEAVGFTLVSVTDIQPGYLAVFKPAPAKDPRSVKACRA